MECYEHRQIHNNMNPLSQYERSHQIYLHICNTSLSGHSDGVQTAVQLAAAHFRPPYLLPLWFPDSP